MARQSLIEPLLLDLREGTLAARRRAAGRAYRLAFGVLAAPGVVLGAAYALLGQPALLPVAVVLGLAVLAAGVAGGALWLAGRTARATDLPPVQAQVGAAIQAASAPAVPFLFGCSLLTQPLAALALFALAAAFFLWAQARLNRFAR